MHAACRPAATCVPSSGRACELVAEHWLGIPCFSAQPPHCLRTPTPELAEVHGVWFGLSDQIPASIANMKGVSRLSAGAHLSCQLDSQAGCQHHLSSCACMLLRSNSAVAFDGRGFTLICHTQRSQAYPILVAADHHMLQAAGFPNCSADGGSFSYTHYSPSGASKQGCARPWLLWMAVTV